MYFRCYTTIEISFNTYWICTSVLALSLSILLLSLVSCMIIPKSFGFSFLLIMYMHKCIFDNREKTVTFDYVAVSYDSTWISFAKIWSIHITNISFYMSSAQYLYHLICNRQHILIYLQLLIKMLFFLLCN